MQLNATDQGYIYGIYFDPVVRTEFEKSGLSHVGDERWYGYSVNVDPVFKDSSGSPNGALVMQWHGNGDACDTTRSPHLGIMVTVDMRWRIQNIHDPNPCTVQEHGGSTNVRNDWYAGNVEKGKWVDWVVYAKWSYRSDGVLKIWKDGKLVVERNGPNAYNDQPPEILKWGVYNSWWNAHAPASTDKLITYVDEIRIGDANSSYAEVAPPGSPPPTTDTTPPSTPTNLTATAQSSSQINLSWTASTASLSVGVDQSTYTYTYKDIYIWKNNQWQKLSNLQGTLIYENKWYRGTVTLANLPLTSQELSQGSFIAAYVATWTGQWKIGCRTQACTGNDSGKWSLMRIRKQ